MADPRIGAQVKDSAEDRMKALEARLEAKLAEADARVKAAEEREEARRDEMSAEIRRIEEAATARIVATEAAASARVEEAKRIVIEATSPAAAQQTPRVSARSREDVDCLCLKTQILGVRAGGQRGRTYVFTKDEVISMDPSHAGEYEAAGWVKRIKGRR